MFTPRSGAVPKRESRRPGSAPGLAPAFARASGAAMTIGFSFRAWSAWLAAGALTGCAAAPSAPSLPPETAAAPVAVEPGIADFYRARGNAPLWIAEGAPRPEALDLLRLVRHAADHGLDHRAYGADALAAALAASRGGDRQALARAELLLSRAFAAFVRDLRAPAAADAVNYIDAGLAPEPPTARALLDGAAAAPSLRAYLAEATRMNPLYDALRRGHGRWRAAGGGTEAQAAAIRRNLDRARAIPAHPGRYVVVDAGSARLWMIDGRRVEGPMRVIVGKPAMQTPAMAGLIRYAALNPYWNLPPDLARDRARRVLREGFGWLARERMEILADWSDGARAIAPAGVDWRAVAAGRRLLRMRQLPGGGNVMGAVKFMMPNDLGIYLHDFPDRSLFAAADRRLSSGCVRVEDASRLARWLFGGTAPRPNGSAPEQRVDLPRAVPVYITYLTALPEPGPSGIAFRADTYGRDRPALAMARAAPR